MPDPKSPETNDTKRTLRPLTCLALITLFIAGAASAQSEKPGAAQASRSRRVADKTEARQQPAASGEAAPVEKPRQDSKAKPTDEPTSAESEAGAESEANAESKSEAKGAAAGPADSEDEIERLRAELKSADAGSRSRLQRELVERLVALGRKHDALSELRLMIHEDRLDPAFFYNTGNALARLGDATAAADAYRKAVAQRRGNYARALNNLGVVLTRQGRWDEAHDALTAALTQENFFYAEASYNLGRLYLLRGETSLALREWKRTLRLQPDHADAAAALARALADDGEEKRAVAVLENFTTRAARTGAAVPRQIAYAREAIAAARDDEREEPRPVPSPGASAPRAPRTPAPRTPARSAVGNAAAPRATRATARRFELTASAYEDFQSAREAGEQGRYEEAARRYRSALSRSGGYFAPANLELGMALLNLNRWYEAINALTPVAERDSARFPVAHYYLARLHERLGRHTTAAEHFARAAELYGDTNPQTLVDLGRVREKAGDVRGALEAIEAYSVAIAKQGSVPQWVTERADDLRAKLKGSQTTQPAKQ